jgi:hypothetical protein
MRSLNTNGHGNLVRTRRKVETERLRKAMPWATEREVQATVEHLLFHLDLSGHFAANDPAYSGLATDTTRGRSAKIWAQGSGSAFPVDSVNNDPTKGVLWWEDFGSFGGTVTTKVGTYAGDKGGWKSYEETGGTIVQSNTLGAPSASVPATGVVTMATDGTANDPVAMEAGYGNGGSFELTGNGMPSLYFEARVAVGPTVMTAMDYFVGLLEKGGAAASFFFSNADAVNQKSFIGFYSLTAAVTAVIPAYGKNGVAPVAITNGSNGLWTPGTTPSWTKLGFVYHPNFTNGRLLQYYQDGVLKGWVTDCSVSAFPTTKVLTPCFILQASAAGLVAGTLSIDWVGVGQCYQQF